MKTVPPARSYPSTRAARAEVRQTHLSAKDVGRAEATRPTASSQEPTNGRQTVNRFVWREPRRRRLCIHAHGPELRIRSGGPDRPVAARLPCAEVRRLPCDRPHLLVKDGSFWLVSRTAAASSNTTVPSRLSQPSPRRHRSPASIFHQSTQSFFEVSERLTDGLAWPREVYRPPHSGSMWLLFPNPFCR